MAQTIFMTVLIRLLKIGWKILINGHLSGYEASLNLESYNLKCFNSESFNLRLRIISLILHNYDGSLGSNGE